MSDPCSLGIDLGGTQLRMAAVARGGRLLSEMVATATGPDFGPDDLGAEVARLATLVKAQIGERPLGALGLGTAGVVRPGPLSLCSNLPRLNGVDLGKTLAAKTGLRVSVENDARCFTLAEARYGAARGARDVVGITLGTGVGCGVMVDGRLHRGRSYEAGEVWDIPLRGKPLQEFVSGKGVVRGYLAAGGDPAQPEASVIAAKARAGDPAAGAAWESLAADLGFLCLCVHRLVDPDAIVLGGSLAQARDLFDAPLRASARAVQDRIVYSVLGPAAGVIGAATFSLEEEIP